MLILGLLGIWCCGVICHEVLTFIQVGCIHTVRRLEKNSTTLSGLYVVNQKNY